MFNLNNNNTYYWYEIFLLLSLGKLAPYLSTIGFPLKSNLPVLTRIAQEFVQEFYNIRSSIYIKGEVSDDARNLFVKIHNRLVSEIGDQDTNLLCEWGNHLQVNARLKYSTKLLWDILLLTFDHEQNPKDTNLPSFTSDKVNTVKEIIVKYKNQLKAMHHTIDMLDAVQKDEWENQAYQMYNNVGGEMGEQDVEASPLDVLASFLDFSTRITLLADVKNSLTAADLQLLETWIASQPIWEKAQAKPRNIYHEPLNLTEILKFSSFNEITGS